MTLGKVFKVLAGRWLLIALTMVVTLATTVVAMSLEPRRYASSAKLVIDFKEPTDLNAVLPAHLQENYLVTQIGILSSRHVMGKAIDLLGYINDPEMIKLHGEETDGTVPIREWLVAYFSPGLRVNVEDSSRLVTVRYVAEDPVMAADLANAAVDAYVDTVLQMNVQPAQKSAEWIDQQLAELRSQLEVAQSSLSAYQQEKGILGTDDRLDVELSQLSTLTDQLLAAQAEVEAFESRLAQVNQRSGDDVANLTIPEVLSSTYVQSLKVDLRRKETELAQISSQLGTRHPQYRQVVAELNTLRTKLKEEVARIIEGMRNQLTAARSRVGSLRRAQSEQKQKLLTSKQTTGDLPAYQREVENAQRAYDDALQRFQQYKLQGRVNQTNVTVLSRAQVPTQPVRARRSIKLALGALLGLILGVGCALLLETRNRLVRGSQDIVDAVNAPLIGTLHKG